jgi:4-amino-4-deoxy-L-arabinose transferase-like glycosyltransferase
MPDRNLHTDRLMPTSRSNELCPAPAAWAALLMLLIWLLPGLFGCEPWKPDGAYTFGLVNHMAASGDWVVPTLAGEPFMEKPPLYFIVAALCEQAFGGWLSLPDAARLASALFIGLAFTALALSARILYGRRHALWAPLLLIGTLGFPVRAHQLITDTALFAGIAWGLYGLLLAPLRPLRGGVTLGLGAAAALLSKGLLGPGVLGLSALLLPLFSPDYRHLNYVKTLVLAVLVGLPLPLLWMVALYQRDPVLFGQWFFVNNLGRFSGASKLGPSADKLFYLQTLPWYAFPAWPLALYGLWKWRRLGGWRVLAAPLTVFGVALAVLSLAADARELYAMPLLAPLSVLAVAGLMAGKPMTLTGRRLWILAALALAALLLLVGFALASGEPAHLVQRLARWTAGWQPHWEPAFWAAGLAALATLLVMWRAGPDCGPGAHLWRWSWLVTLVWALAFTLWLPAIDPSMSYQQPFQQLRPALQQASRSGCIASDGLGEPQRALLEYYADMVTRRIETHPGGAAGCTWLLLQSRDGGIPRPLAQHGLNPVLMVARPGDTKERYLLYRVPQTVGMVYNLLIGSDGSAKRSGSSG